MKKTFILTLAVVCSLLFLHQVHSYQTNAQESKEEKQSSIIRKSEGQLRPTATNRVAPEYPVDAKTNKVEGDVVVEVTISEEGNVINAKAISGDQVFIQPTLDAVKKWTFSPTKVNDKPTKVSGVLSFRFKLESPNFSTPSKAKQTDTLPTQTVIRRSEGVLRGIAVDKSYPTYPAEAKEQKVEGDVVIEVTIDEEGKVSSTRPVSGHELLKDVAEKAAKEWTFKPTSLDGKPVKVTGVITFRFLLDEK